MNQRGSAVVEWALVLPALLVLIAALAEVTLIARTQIEVIGAAREGVRVAATTPNTDAAVARARAALRPELAAAAVVTVLRPATVGSEAVVDIAVVHRVAGAMFGGVEVEVVGRAVMRVEV